MNIYEYVPFPAVVSEPTALAVKLQERIKYMFCITVEPVIFRHPGSYYKTCDFRFMWSMRTPCGRFEIACYESAAVMADKPAWQVLDHVSLLEYPGDTHVTGKVIY